MRSDSLALDARDRFIADAEFTTRLEHLLSADTADRLAALIDPARPVQNLAANTELIHKDTVLLVVVDRDLMAVSMIYSIFHSFVQALHPNDTV